MTLKLDDSRVRGFIEESELKGILPLAERAFKAVSDKSGEGGEFAGFTELPKNYDREELERIKEAAERIRGDSRVLVVIGIGGSYLGARSAIELIQGVYRNELESGPRIIYAGNTLSADYLDEILRVCEGKDFSVNVVSKSGNTVEPAIAFRIFKNLLEEKYGKAAAASRIYCTTDKTRGALRKLALQNGYETFSVPDNIGGRYSVLTAVGLLPLAVAGVDIEQVLEGAFEAMKDTGVFDIKENAACRYAVLRNLLYSKGREIELFTAYEPRFALFGEFLKQLFGESEGKNGKGIFPASMINTTDLHSMGQYVQEGRRSLFETVISIRSGRSEITIPHDGENGDGMAFLNGKSLDTVNARALEAASAAHADGGVPVIRIELEDTRPHSVGYLIYFFQKACAVSGYLLGVNPFNQPGVEGYKNNMYALLGKPGYEELAAALKKRVSE